MKSGGLVALACVLALAWVLYQPYLEPSAAASALAGREAGSEGMGAEEAEWLDRIREPDLRILRSLARERLRSATREPPAPLPSWPHATVSYLSLRGPVEELERFSRRLSATDLSFARALEIAPVGIETRIEGVAASFVTHPAPGSRTRAILLYCLDGEPVEVGCPDGFRIEEGVIGTWCAVLHPVQESKGTALLEAFRIDSAPRVSTLPEALARSVAMLGALCDAPRAEAPAPRSLHVRPGRHPGRAPDTDAPHRVAFERLVCPYPEPAPPKPQPAPTRPPLGSEDSDPRWEEYERRSVAWRAARAARLETLIRTRDAAFLSALRSAVLEAGELGSGTDEIEDLAARLLDPKIALASMRARVVQGGVLHGYGASEA